MNHITLLRGAAAAILALTSAAAPALAVKPFSADYTASYMGLQGPAKMQIASAGGDRWTYTVSINSNIAQLSQSTTFEDRGGRWRPLSSTDSSAMLMKKNKVDANYDWSKRQATWSGSVKSDRAGPVALQDGDMDALLLNLAVARDAAAGKPMKYRLVDDGRAKDMTYTLEGKDTLTIGGKPTQATKVSRTDGNKQMIVWVVDGLPVPARILQRKNGNDDIDLKINALR